MRDIIGGLMVAAFVWFMLQGVWLMAAWLNN